MELYVRHGGSALAVAVLVAVASAWAGAGTGAEAASPPRPCNPDGSTTLAHSAEARVYQVERTRDGHSTLYTYGCLKRSGSQVLLASDAEPAAVFPLPSISLIGPYVGYAVDTDTDPEAPGGRMTYIEVDDLRPQEPGQETAGLVVNAGHGDVARVGGLKVSRTGAVAWIACPAPADGPLVSDPRGSCTRPGAYDRVFEARLDAQGTAHVREIDHGRGIDPHSLRHARHSSVAWQHGKATRIEKLR